MEKYNQEKQFETNLQYIWQQHKGSFDTHDDLKPTNLAKQMCSILYQHSLIVSA